jgi:hypothetical protein
MLRTKLLAGLALVGGLCLAAPPARAGLIPTLVTVFPNLDGTFRWTYAVTVTSDVNVNTGDYFTIYDFSGGIAGSDTAPANWSLAVQNLGKTPSQTAPNDDANIPNYSWTYDGATPISGQIGLGNFSIVSKYGSPADSDFTSATHREIDGKSEHNITTTNVPVAAASPEPATLAMFCIGLPVVGAFKLLRRKRAA